MAFAANEPTGGLPPRPTDKPHAERVQPIIETMQDLLFFLDWIDLSEGDWLLLMYWYAAYVEAGWAKKKGSAVATGVYLLGGAVEGAMGPGPDENEQLLTSTGVPPSEQAMTGGGGVGSSWPPPEVVKLENDMATDRKVTHIHERQNPDGTWTITWLEANGVEWGGVIVPADVSWFEWLLPGTEDPMGPDKVLAPTPTGPTPGGEGVGSQPPPPPTTPPPPPPTPLASTQSTPPSAPYAPNPPTPPRIPGQSDLARAAITGASVGMSGPMAIANFYETSGINDFIRERAIRPALTMQQRLSPMNNVRWVIDRITGAPPAFDQDALQSGLIVAGLGAFGMNPKETPAERGVREQMASFFGRYFGELGGQIVAGSPYIATQVGAGLLPIGGAPKGGGKGRSGADVDDFPAGTLGAARNKVPTPRENPWAFESASEEIAKEFQEEFLRVAREIKPLKAETARYLSERTALPADGFTKVSSTTYFDDLGTPFEYHWYEHASRPGERLFPKIKWLDE